MPIAAYLAIDLGAESGRVIVGKLAEGKLTIHEAHRFVHEPCHWPSGLHWNLTGLWQQILTGCRRAADIARTQDLALKALGVDTWGVDFGLLGASGELLSLPHAYRDPRNNAAYEKTVAALTEQTIYDATGIQMMPLNTLYQLVAANDADPTLLPRAAALLFMPDLLNYLLTGEQAVEATIASTSQMLDPRTGQWATTLLAKLNLPTQMLGNIMAPGSKLGPIRREVAETTTLPENLPLILAPSHDTAAAVAAVPADPNTNWCYLSSGTWSLMGAQLDKPVLTAAARAAGFTNEGGIRSIRFLKNIAGLWLVQECRRVFDHAGQKYDYAQLTAAAAEAEPFATLVDPDHPPLLAPGRMPEKIARFARATGQRVPETPGQFVRCCLESLALKYRMTFELLEQVLERRFEVLHIVGGGGKNQLLNQMTADAVGRRVVVGPYEATAIGNLLTQAMGAGDVRDPGEIRRIVRRSFDVSTVEPNPTAAWADACQRFSELSNTGQSA